MGKRSCSAERLCNMSSRTIHVRFDEVSLVNGRPHEDTAAERQRNNSATKGRASSKDSDLCRGMLEFSSDAKLSEPRESIMALDWPPKRSWPMPRHAGRQQQLPEPPTSRRTDMHATILAASHRRPAWLESPACDCTMAQGVGDNQTWPLRVRPFVYKASVPPPLITSCASLFRIGREAKNDKANSLTDGSPPVSSHEQEKPAMATVEQVSSNEKDGARGYNVDEALDPDYKPVMTFKRMMSLVAMAFLWIGSQIPIYLFGGVPPYIYGDIGGADRWIWFVLANLLSLAAVCPFVGSISDLIGRRYVALMGASLLILGMIICSTAHTMNVFIGGMVFAGMGAGINELTALAVTSELAPTRQRGKYNAILVFTIIPFCPSVLWAQLIAYHSSWRYIGLLCALWAFIGLVLTAVFYFPPPRENSKGKSRSQVLKRFGEVINTNGRAPTLLAPLILVWQHYAPYPMFPRRALAASHPDTEIHDLLMSTRSPTRPKDTGFNPCTNVYGHDPVGVGIRGIPVGFSILAGACIVLWLLSVFRGHNRELMIVSSVLMTAGCGALAVGNRDNLSTLCIGYCVYYNVFINKFVPLAIKDIGIETMFVKWNITSFDEIKTAIELTGAGLLPEIAKLPDVASKPGAYEAIVLVGQVTYAAAYKYVYLVSIAFGGVAILASIFLGDISKYMDDHIAVIM
ncbi:hypothetical protein MRB53_038388 [Persea americana]|nr:hypothetical protein MRB53_038388 [Persea americana]